MNKRDIGNISEDLACEYLLKNDCIIVGRNITRAYGEIDVLFLDKKSNELVALEVKTISDSYDATEISSMVNPYKIVKIKKVLSSLIASNLNLSYDGIRFDVMAIRHNKEICHYKGVC